MTAAEWARKELERNPPKWSEEDWAKLAMRMRLNLVRSRQGAVETGRRFEIPDSLTA